MSLFDLCSVCGQKIQDGTSIYKLVLEGPQDRHYEDFTTLFTICTACFCRIVFGLAKGLEVKDAKIFDEG